MSNTLLHNTTLAMIALQELADGPIHSFHYVGDIYDAMAEAGVTSLPDLDVTLNQARELYKHYKANGGFVAQTFRFYGLYHDEPQSYDSHTTVYIPALLLASDAPVSDANWREVYATAAAALTLIEDNDNIDILSNFTLENIYHERETFIGAFRKKGMPSSDIHTVMIEADNDAQAIMCLNTVAAERLGCPIADIETSVSTTTALKRNLIVAPE